MKILVFDNYDSFTYNLVHLVERITGIPVVVKRNDEISLDEVDGFDRIILSPGPGIPQEAGLLLPLIRAYSAKKPILGVCLGHQAIGEAFGAKLVNLDRVYHGLSLPVKVLQREGTGVATDLFAGLPEQFAAGRYHSWVIDPEGFPSELEITATDEAGNIMALRHRHLDVLGVQFHPESVLTPEGEIIMRNWLN
jgi:anthranilate synthase component II